MTTSCMVRQSNKQDKNHKNSLLFLSFIGIACFDTKYMALKQTDMSALSSDLYTTISILTFVLFIQ
jgi:hypothetical protein